MFCEIVAVTSVTTRENATGDGVSNRDLRASKQLRVSVTSVTNVTNKKGSFLRNFEYGKVAPSHFPFFPLPAEMFIFRGDSGDGGDGSGINLEKRGLSHRDAVTTRYFGIGDTGDGCRP